jgi:hypothetical protein
VFFYNDTKMIYVSWIFKMEPIFYLFLLNTKNEIIYLILVIFVDID